MSDAIKPVAWEYKQSGFTHYTDDFAEIELSIGIDEYTHLYSQATVESLRAKVAELDDEAEKLCENEKVWFARVRALQAMLREIVGAWGGEAVEAWGGEAVDRDGWDQEGRYGDLIEKARELLK